MYDSFADFPEKEHLWQLYIWIYHGWNVRQESLDQIPLEFSFPAFSGEKGKAGTCQLLWSDMQKKTLEFTPGLWQVCSLRHFASASRHHHVQQLCHLSSSPWHIIRDTTIYTGHVRVNFSKLVWDRIFFFGQSKKVHMRYTFFCILFFSGQ